MKFGLAFVIFLALVFATCQGKQYFNFTKKFVKMGTSTNFCKGEVGITSRIAEYFTEKPPISRQQFRPRVRYPKENDITVRISSISPWCLLAAYGFV